MRFWLDIFIFLVNEMEKVVHAFVTVFSSVNSLLSFNLPHITAIKVGIMSNEADADKDEKIKSLTFQSPHRSFIHKAPVFMSS